MALTPFQRKAAFRAEHEVRSSGRRRELDNNQTSLPPPPQTTETIPRPPRRSRATSASIWAEGSGGGMVCRPVDRRASLRAEHEVRSSGRRRDLDNDQISPSPQPQTTETIRRPPPFLRATSPSIWAGGSGGGMACSHDSGRSSIRESHKVTATGRRSGGKRKHNGRAAVATNTQFRQRIPTRSRTSTWTRRRLTSQHRLATPPPMAVPPGHAPLLS